MSKDAVAAGAEFGQIIIESLCRRGVPEEGRLAFYVTELGVQMGNIAAHVGKESALVLLDLIREQIATLPNRKAETSH